jgi:hypothetical protein
MTGFSRFPKLNPFESFIDAPDSVYGSGSDGIVTISSNTTLTSDKYYYNLTVDSNIVLNTNGYRVFVKNVLTLNGNSTIGFTTGSSVSGSIAGGGSVNQSVTNSLGGNSATQTATPPTTASGGTGVKPDSSNSATLTGYWYQPTQAVKGYTVTASQTTPLFLRGGAGGSGGSGGGVVIIASRYIASAGGTSYIKAPGTSGGGGGGGGVIIIISATPSLPLSISTDVTGGTSCANGTVIYSQLV